MLVKLAEEHFIGKDELYTFDKYLKETLNVASLLLFKKNN